jgi:hypothetical protein
MPAWFSTASEYVSVKVSVGGALLEDADDMTKWE